MNEFEKKFILTEQEYVALCHSLPGKTFVQTNYYYDTDDLFYHKRGITCRIRHKGNRYKATVKTHKYGKDSSAERSVWAKNGFDFTAFSGMNVHFQGVLSTKRKNVSLPDGILISLDQNSFLGIVDYELEIEYDPKKKGSCQRALFFIAQILSPNESVALLQDFKQRNKIKKSKSVRFFERKKQMKEGSS